MYAPEAMRKTKEQLVRNLPRRKASEIDEAVGRRIRLRRQLLEMSQQELAELCCISSQQIHKYESGRSRLPSSRLVQFASVLRTPVSWFFEDIEEHPSLPDDLIDLLVSKDVGEMIALMAKIDEPELRKGLIEMARRCARIDSDWEHGEPASALPARRISA